MSEKKLVPVLSFLNVLCAASLKSYLVQFQKMETKMSFLAEVENMVHRSRELTEKMRKKLLLERNAIIASRMAAMASRTNQPGAPPATRLPVPVALVQQLRRP